MIIAFQSFAFHADHCTHHTTIIINHANIIIVTNILDATLIIVGNALSAAVSFAPPPDFFKQFHKNGIDVFSGIHGSIQSPFTPYLQVQYDDHFHL